MRPLSPDDLMPKGPPDTSWYSHRAPLKRNALKTLRADYAQMGFATAPVRQQKESIAVRVVWIYPDCRGMFRYRFYVSVGLVTIQNSDYPSTVDWHFRLHHQSRHSSVFRPFFSQEKLLNCKPMFSPEGISEVETVLRSKQAGGHARTLQTKRRRRIIAELPELWHDPRRIVCLLRDCGLYSVKTPVDQQIYSVEETIRRLRKTV